MCSKIFRFKTIDSTHKFAIRLIETRNEDNCVIIAQHQTDGIGRCGREWLSPSGNLLMSMISNLPNVDFGQLSLAVACAVHETISSFISDNNLRLHWPNDIYCQNRKISGILLSIVNDKLVISVGINVNSAPDLGTAISMRDISGKVVSVDSVFSAVITRIKEWMNRLENLGFFHVKRYWLRYINEINRNVTIKNGQETLSGIFTGLDDSGRLMLKKEGRNLLISSGDMFINEKGITVDYD
ncbi:MAG: biotin--[acetyl-CoA-carboxylase] ligase [Alphaproteobacteria bacterium]|nr:biotin--[acetyl-CoA-carboxylase] ligase [Alphaproteobacteria bacterium]